MKFILPQSRRVLLLFLTFVAGLLVSSIITGVLVSVASEDRTLAMMRIGAVVQDLLMLVVPAVLTAVLSTRTPAALLTINKGFKIMPCLIAVLVMLVASPAMSFVIELNQNVHFPSALSGFEASLRAMEETAGGAVEMMLGGHTAGNLIVSLLIVGIMAGFCEELFFRGAMQRIFSTSMQPATAVWLTAVIFSLIHFQFFGFVPRLLLGAYLGYLLLWSGSVWLPIVIHTFNNSLYVILRYTTGSGEPSPGDFYSAWPTIVASIIATAAGIILLRRLLCGSDRNSVARPENS